MAIMTPETSITPVKPGIACVEADGVTVTDLSHKQAKYVLDADERIRHEWVKYTGMSGQIKKPVEERTGRIILLDAERVRRLLDGRTGADGNQVNAETVFDGTAHFGH